MTQPSFSCPRCGYTTFGLGDAACPFCSHEPTRAEIETDWFGAPVTAPTFRVARFVQALRRLRSR